jgi:hypothetical protein
MKKRSFLLPLATALAALTGGIGPVAAHLPSAEPTTIDAARQQTLNTPATLPADLMIERPTAAGQKFAQHRSHSSHSSHRSHYSSRR